MNLFTSLPPKVSRIVEEKDVGTTWTRMCINSWKSAGYEVHSVNSGLEAGQVKAAYPDINVIEVPRDGMAVAGRPVVFLSDMLSLGVQRSSSSFAIANADVMILSDAGNALRGWVPHEGFAISNRLEIFDLLGSNPKLHHAGVDFAILNTRDLAKIKFPDFLFGMPWWDCWLPLALNCVGVKGCKIKYNGIPVIAHLFHKDRWNSRDFLNNFTTFISAIANIVGEREALPSHVYEVDSSSGLPGPLLKICLEYAKATSLIVRGENSTHDL